MNLTNIIDSIQLMLLISLCTGVFWAIWIHILTPPSGLFKAIPKLYPNEGFLAHIVRCEVCLSGWTSMILVPLLSSSIVNGIALVPISGAMGIFTAIIATRLMGK